MIAANQNRKSKSVEAITPFIFPEKNILVFRTSIETTQNVRFIGALLDGQSLITDWFVDTEDIDNVLRIEGDEKLKEKDIIALIRQAGFYCEAL